MFILIGLYGIEVLPLKKLKELPHDLAERLDIPDEVLCGAGRVIISGGRHALIEEHRGIIEYSDTKTVVAFVRGKLTVSGSALKIEAMNQSELILSGRIQSVEWG